MRVWFTLAERRGCPIESYWPELLAATDEGTWDENPDAYRGDLARARESWGDDLAREREFIIDVPDDLILRAFREHPIPSDRVQPGGPE